MRTLLTAVLLGLLAACGASDDPVAGEATRRTKATAGTSADSPRNGRPEGDATSETADEMAPSAAAATPLPAFFDCVRENGAVVLAAHRGGPVPGLPENAIETMQHGLDNGIFVFEVDVAESRDGVLFLMHDRSLGRTTTLQGAVVDTLWEDIALSRLIDAAGTETFFHPPKLADALRWAVENNAILELDRKPSTSFRNIIASVRAAGATNNTILITYDDNDVAVVARLAPDMMLTASARGNADINRLEQLGIARERLIAWTGTRAPDPAAFDRLLDEQVEPAFGTLGRRGERLDDLWLADGDAAEFEALIGDGVVLLATDAALDLAPLLDADDRALTTCLR